MIYDIRKQDADAGEMDKRASEICGTTTSHAGLHSRRTQDTDVPFSVYITPYNVLGLTLDVKTQCPRDQQQFPIILTDLKIWLPYSKSSVVNSSLERLCQTSTWKLGLWSLEERLLSLVVFPEPLPSCQTLCIFFYLPSPLLVGGVFSPPVMKSANNPLELTSLGTRSIRSAFSSHEYPDSKIETPFHYGTPSTLIREGINQEISTQQNLVLLGQHSRRKITFPTWLSPKTKTSKTKRGQKEVLSTQYGNLDGGKFT